MHSVENDSRAGLAEGPMQKEAASAPCHCQGHGQVYVAPVGPT